MFSLFRISAIIFFLFVFASSKAFNISLVIKSRETSLLFSDIRDFPAKVGGALSYHLALYNIIRQFGFFSIIHKLVSNHFDCNQLAPLFYLDCKVPVPWYYQTISSFPEELLPNHQVFLVD